MARAATKAGIALVVCSCAGQSPTASSSPAVPASAVAASATVDPSLVSVVAVRSPTQVVIDGNLDEWGPPPSPPPSLPAPVPYDEAESPARGVAAPNPPGAASRLRFALGESAAFVAAELGGEAIDGIWLGIGSEPAPLPLPGSYAGNLGYIPLGRESRDCATTPKLIADGSGYVIAARSPEAQEACKAEIALHSIRKQKHERRFMRLYRLDRQGVRSLSESGELAEVPGAKWAASAGSERTTIEVSLPLDALPRMARAPLDRVRIAARSSRASPSAIDASWVWLALPAPVSFEPFGALRAHAFKRAADYGEAGLDGFGVTSYRLPRGLSFQPGRPRSLEIVDSADCRTLAAREVQLYTKVAMLGDVEVGYVASPRGGACAAESEPWLAIFVKGELKGIEPTLHARGTAVRGGELHVFGFSETPWSSVGGVWSVIALAPDGTPRTNLVEPVVGLKEPGGKDPYWSDVSDFSSKDLDTFGWRGTAGKRALEATWRWDEARHAYRGTQRPIPPPPRRPRH